MNTKQERADLLPCPFCGSTNIEIQISTPDREGVPTNLMCSDCGASGPWEYEQVNSHARADAAWNTRAALQSQDREDAERLEWLVEAMGRLDMDEGHRGWFILERDTSRYVVEDCKTFREAIDRARHIEGEEE